MKQKRFGSSTGGTNAPFFDGSQVCAQVDPELFFPDNPAESVINMKLVKPLCKSCEFQTECLEYALSNRELLGIWAGTTEKDRARLRRFGKKIA